MATNPFKMTRIGTIMEPELGNPQEEEGVLNPAVARGPDGELYIFPRLVAKGNFSRIGIAKVLFNDEGDPVGVERIGIVLEPEMDYELRPNGGGGCEDPRITFVEPLKHYIMTYTAFGPNGPRIALAKSTDLLHWERMGLATFSPYYNEIDFNGIVDKDASLFPIAIPNPSEHKRVAMLHRPLFRGTTPEETVRQSHEHEREVDINRESIWISYTTLDPEKEEAHFGKFTSHYRLASPVEPWEALKIGGGAPPILTRHGWLLIYHGVSEGQNAAKEGDKECLMCYSAGAMILSRTHPQHIKYRSPGPILSPETEHERIGVVDDVVFPTGLDRRDDLGSLDRIDIYYGMADRRIGVASLIVPKNLPSVSKKDAPGGKV